MPSFDPFGDMEFRHGPDPVDPGSGLVVAAYRIALVAGMLSSGRFNAEGLTHTERHDALNQTGNVLKALFDVMERLRHSNQDEIVRAAFAPLMASLETSIDALLLVEFAERDAQGQHNPL